METIKPPGEVMPGSYLKQRLKCYLSIFVAVLLVGTLGFMLIEKHSLADSLYFTIVTIATVGFGDISPVTPLGKALTLLIIVTGVGTFVGVVANATEILLEKRNEEARLKKLHMIIGLFFSEHGIHLMRTFVAADPAIATLGNSLLVKDSWEKEDFRRAEKRLPDHDFVVDFSRVDLEKLRLVLEEQGSILVRLLESPYLLEHEKFTDLLIAIVHLKEEILHREDLTNIPETDSKHLTGDIRRAYSLMALLWLGYMRHLQTHYPFLFSLAMRTNPFDPNAEATVKQ